MKNNEMIEKFFEKALSDKESHFSAKCDGNMVHIYLNGIEAGSFAMKAELENAICGRSYEDFKRAYNSVNKVASLLKNPLKMDSYEEVRNKLILRPVNYEIRKEDLKNVPYIRIGDIALALYVEVWHSGGDYYTTKIQKDNLKTWGKDAKEVISAAMNNTKKKYPPVAYSVDFELKTEPMVHEIEDFFGDCECNFDAKYGCILTNELQVNGAIAAFYPGVMRKVAERMGDDIYLAFTSINDAQIHKASNTEFGVIKEALMETNRACNADYEILANEAYCYSRKKQCFGVIKNGAFHALEVKISE